MQKIQYTANLRLNIKKFCDEKQWSIARLEREAKIPEGSVHNICRGIAKNPSLHNIFAVARALDVSVEDLVMPPQCYQINDYIVITQIFDIVIKEIADIALPKLSLNKVFRIIEAVHIETIQKGYKNINASYIRSIVKQHMPLL